MKAQDPVIGMIGLLQWVDPLQPAPAEERTRLGIGDIVFVMQTDDAHEVYRRLQAFGARIHAPPHLYEVTGADGTHLSMTEVSFWDPDGYFIELNQRH
jgi:hypothetical protein